MDQQLSEQVYQMNKRGQDAILVLDQYASQIVEHLVKVFKRVGGAGDGVAVIPAVTNDPTNATSVSPDISNHPTYQTMQLLGNLVRFELQDLKQADLFVAQEKDETRIALNKREEELVSARDRLVRLRLNVVSLYGEAYANSLGFRGDTPNDPRKLEQIVQLLVNKVSQEGFSFPEPLNDDMPSWTVASFKGFLEKLIAPLEKATQNAARESKEDQDAQIQRRAALESTRYSITAFTSAIETLARLAGLSEIADRIRPINRGPKQDGEANTNNTDPNNPSDDPLPNKVLMY